MAELKPFRGYRFRLDKPEDLGRFISPPYDMLNEEQIKKLCGSDSHNTVRIIQNPREPSDAGNIDRHRRAAALFAQWRRDGIIVHDEKPSLYLYRHEFAGPGGKPVQRTGFVARVKLVDFAEKIVLPHENTLSAPKVDRYEHMQAVHANTEQVFGIMEDSGDLYSLLAAASACRFEGSCVDQFGVRHMLGRIEDSRTIDALTTLAAPRTILIADGHHRYETALKFWQDTRNPAAGYVMMTLVSMADPGLVIRPFHRLIKIQNSMKPSQVTERLRKLFDIKESSDAAAATVTSFVNSPEDGSLLFFDGQAQKLHRLILSKAGEEALAVQGEGKSSTWTHLNVSKVNLLFINNILGLSLDGVTLHDQVAYEQDVAAVLAAATPEKGFYGAFFLRPIGIQTIRRIVDGGERMPQKSTNFFPKIWSGLVFNVLEQA
jgi:uncharacterized protein (DUF1015 family)